MNISWLTKEKLSLLLQVNTTCDVMCLFENEKNNTHLYFSVETNLKLTSLECHNLISNLQKINSNYVDSFVLTTTHHGPDVTVNLWGLVLPTPEGPQVYLIRIAYNKSEPLQALMYKHIEEGSSISTTDISTDPLVQYLKANWLT